MKRSTLTGFGLAVFAMVFLAFLVRAFGQFLLGPRRATLVAGPIVVVAAVVLVGVLGVALLARLGLVTVEDPDY